MSVRTFWAGQRTVSAVSPDGRWVAYDQDTPQGRQIFVSPVSRPAEQHQISTNRGFKPRWRPDGKEIFFQMPPERFMAAEVRIAGDTVEVAAMRQLFDGFPTSGGYLYDVSADGQRILAAVPISSLKARYPITLVQNWAAALQK